MNPDETPKDEEQKHVSPQIDIQQLIGALKSLDLETADALAMADELVLQAISKNCEDSYQAEIEAIKQYAPFCDRGKTLKEYRLVRATRDRLKLDAVYLNHMWH